MAEVPGIAAKHAFITDLCRTGRGEMQAFDEAARRLREEYRHMIDGWPIGKGAKFHMVLTVEKPEQKEETP